MTWHTDSAWKWQNLSQGSSLKYKYQMKPLLDLSVVGSTRMKRLDLLIVILLICGQKCSNCLKLVNSQPKSVPSSKVSQNIFRMIISTKIIHENIAIKFFFFVKTHCKIFLFLAICERWDWSPRWWWRTWRKCGERYWKRSYDHVSIKSRVSYERLEFFMHKLV